MSDLENTVRYFLARSDVESAYKLASANGMNTLVSYMKEYWPAYFSEQGYRKTCQVTGDFEATFDGERIFTAIAGQWRLQSAIALFQQMGIKTALDFACGRAHHAIHIHNAVGTRWTCVDINPTLIDHAKQLVQKFANDPSAFEFHVGDEGSFAPTANYEAVMAMEVFEHITDMQSLAQKLETYATMMVFATMPSGPSEYTCYIKEHPHRNRQHVREFTLEDIYEVWGKKQVFVSYQSMGTNQYLQGMHEGNFCIAYKADKEPLGQVNWERKLSLRGIKEPIFLPGLDS